MNAIWSNSHEGRNSRKNCNSKKLYRDFKETHVHVFIEPHFPSKIGFILLKSAGQLLSLSTMIWVISGAQIQNFRTGGESVENTSLVQKLSSTNIS